MLILLYDTDSDGDGIFPSSQAKQLAWIRTGHGQGKAPAQTLPYEFAFLYVDSQGHVQDAASESMSRGSRGMDFLAM